MACGRVVRRRIPPAKMAAISARRSSGDISAGSRGVGDESVAITDHSFKGERDVLVAEHVSKTALSALRLTAPTSEVFRVFERRAQVCRSMPPPKRELALEVIILKDDNRGNWGEKFVWRIE